MIRVPYSCAVMFGAGWGSFFGQGLCGVPKIHLIDV
jgi:hypothetical protein